MRAVAVASALLLALAARAAAQDAAFTDADFGFSIKLPAGLTAVDAAHLAAVPGEAGPVTNPPRAESGGKPVTHVYAWYDTSSPYNRQVAIELHDGSPPWKPDDFPDAMTKSGLAVDMHEALKAPVSGWRVEGTFERQPDKLQIRKTVMYLPDLFGKHYGLVTLQCNASDWNIVKDEFLAALNSTRLQRAAPPKEVTDALKQQATKGEADASGDAATPPAGKPGAGKPGAGKPGGAKAGGAKGGAGKAAKGGKPGEARAEPAAAPVAPVAVEADDWGSLQVAGSFVLAAVVLAHLLLSGRAPR